MSENFDNSWKDYVDAYGKINSQVYFDDLTKEVHRRKALTE